MSNKSQFDRVSQRDLATIHGVDQRTIRRWDDEGHPRNADGTYAAPTSIAWRLQRELGDGADLARERARLAREQADRVATENATKRGELCDLRDLEEALGRLFANFRMRLLGMPSKLGPLINASNPNLARDRLAVEVNDILAEFAAFDPAAAGRRRSGNGHRTTR